MACERTVSLVSTGFENGVFNGCYSLARSRVLSNTLYLKVYVNVLEFAMLLSTKS